MQSHCEARPPRYPQPAKVKEPKLLNPRCCMLKLDPVHPPYCGDKCKYKDKPPVTGGVAALLVLLLLPILPRCLCRHRRGQGEEEGVNHTRHSITIGARLHNSRLPQIQRYHFHSVLAYTTFQIIHPFHTHPL